MSFSTDQGYVPLAIDELMEIVRVNINTQFSTNFTQDEFIGSGHYKNMYSLVQRLQENEVKASEIVLKLQQYFIVTNEMIQRPKTTHPGIVDVLLEAGFEASTKPPELADAGKVYVCVNVVDNHARGEVEITSYANLVSGTDDSVTVGATVFTAQAGSATPGAATFQAATSNALTAVSLAAQINAHATAGALVEAWVDGAVVIIRALSGGTGGNAIALAYTDNDTNVGATVSAATLLGGIVSDDEYDDIEEEISEILSDCIAGGIVSMGREGVEVTLPNLQAFEYLYALPERQRTYLKLTIGISDHNEHAIPSDEEIKAVLLANVIARYKMGRDFEPDKYFSTEDAPWAASILLQYSDDDMSYASIVEENDFDFLREFDIDDISLVQS